MRRLPAEADFASWNGTRAGRRLLGDQVRHRLSRAGGRQINRVLHIMAVVQLRHPTEGRAYYERKVAAGKTQCRKYSSSRPRLPSQAPERADTSCEKNLRPAAARAAPPRRGRLRA